MRKHHELRVWQEGMNLVQEVYKATAQFLQHEQYGLTTQLRRAAVSVPSNIAEGAARETSKEFAKFLVMARGSLSEIETQPLIAKGLGYLLDETVTALLGSEDSVFALLSGLLRSVKERSSP